MYADKHNAPEHIYIYIYVIYKQSTLYKNWLTLEKSNAGVTTLLKKMEGCELIKQGAEAKLYQGLYLGKPAMIKERFVKKYRQPELDTQITNERIKAEARIIARCNSIGVSVPTLYLVDLDRRLIVMQFLQDACTMKDFFHETDDAQLISLMCNQIGRGIAKMHKNNIIHGDLTTSNMLQIEKQTPGISDSGVEIKAAFIDFGLSYIESSVEDKGVDLYVLERALLSTHSDGVDLFKKILQAYMDENKKEGNQVMKKFEEVRARGRKRTMVG